MITRRELQLFFLVMLLSFVLTVQAVPLGPLAAAEAAAPTAPPAAAAAFGAYREGQFPVPQFFVTGEYYLGFSHKQFFRPAYRAEIVPIHQLPWQFACCIVHPAQHNGSVQVVHVYLDPSPAGTGNGIVGPIDSWIVAGDELISVTPPYLGRRVKRVPGAPLPF